MNIKNDKSSYPKFISGSLIQSYKLKQSIKDSRSSQEGQKPIHNNKKAFSLIEVVISTVILSLTVFGVYKLIAENNKIITNSNNYLDANILLSNAISCMENMGFDILKTSMFITQTGSFYFENSLTGKCMTGVYNTNLSFTGIRLNNLDYFLFAKIVNSGNNYIDWNIGVYSDSIGKIEKNYKMWK